MNKSKDTETFEVNDYSALNRGVNEVSARASIATRLLHVKLFIEQARAFFLWALVLGLLLVLMGIAIFIGRGNLDMTFGGTTEKIRYIKVPDPEKSQVIEKTIIVEKPVIRPINTPETSGVSVSFTIFRTVDNPNGLDLSVTTGLNYKNSDARFPTDQYCYADTESKNLGVFNRVYLASKNDTDSIKIEKINNNQAQDLGVLNEPANKLHAHCLFDTDGREPGQSNTDEKENTKIPPKVSSSTGTGFAINSKGVFLTNAHVVDDCSVQGLIYDGKPQHLQLIDKDDKLDLAILKSTKIKVKKSLKFAESLKTGQDILAFGYPLQGELSRELKVTSGIVSSLAGMKDDRSRIQITAAIQPGNSGGPVVDNKGLVVGIAVSGLKGELIENVNFAIKKDYVLKYLSKNGVNFEIASDASPQKNTEIVDQLKQVVLPVFCLKD